MSKKVIVVGGGLAGLTAANFAAKANCEVMLFEKSQAVGGRAATSEKSGVRFNLGPHALYRGGQAFKILRELGVEFTGGVPKVDGTLAIDGGRKHSLPGGTISLMATSLFGLSAKLEAARALTALPKLDAATVNHLTVNEWLNKEIRNDDLRRLLGALFRLSTYANDPDRLSARVAVSQLQMALAKSVLLPDSGWQTMVDGLRAKAESAGVKIVAEARVAKII